MVISNLTRNTRVNREEVAEDTDKLNRVQTDITGNRHFIITKRQKPLKFKDMGQKVDEYEFVDNDSAATIFDSMSETMLVLEKMCRNGESGIWYREIQITGEIEEHLYCYVLDGKTKKYIAYNEMKNALYYTPYQYKAYKCTRLADILEFGLRCIPKETLNDLKIIDLKENDNEFVRVYLYYNTTNSVDTDKLLDSWFRMGDEEAFKKFTDIIEYGVVVNENSDIFKKEVLKLLGARRYLTDTYSGENKEFTKNALINIFVKMTSIEVTSERDVVNTMLFIEWFIRNKLMTASEVKWIISTKWFDKTSKIMKEKYKI